MGTWRCPHCRTLQADGPRCFLCNRSATSCGTCVNFRRAVVGGLGYCALDGRREPLTGAEQRACWSAVAEPVSVGTDGLFAPAAPPPAAAHGAAAEPEPPTRRGRLVELPTSRPISGS